MSYLLLTHLSNVEGCEAHGEDDQHCGQQLDSPPSPLPEETQLNTLLNTHVFLCGIFLNQNFHFEISLFRTPNTSK